MGEYRELECPESVLAFERVQGSTRVLCLNNLTAWPQLVEVNLPGLDGRTPAVLSGTIPEAPQVVGDSYRIELPPYGYAWLLFTDPPAEEGGAS